MYALTVYIEPKDILDKLSEEEKARFNQCTFTDVRRCKDSSVEIECMLFNDKDIFQESLYRCKYCSTQIKL